MVEGLDFTLNDSVGKMNLTYTLLALFLHITFALQSKMFSKYLTEPSSILADQVKQLKQSHIAMDRVTCSTFCLKDEDNCDAFYIEDQKNCMLIKNATGLLESEPSNSEAIVVYSSVNLAGK